MALNFVYLIGFVFTWLPQRKKGGVGRLARPDMWVGRLPVRGPKIRCKLENQITFGRTHTPSAKMEEKTEKNTHTEYVRTHKFMNIEN